jgi:YtkA-like
MRLLTVLSFAVLLSIGCGGAGETAPLKELQRVHSGDLDIVLLSAGDSLKQGKGTFVIEFRDASGTPVDVGTVTIAASMSMPGMAPMFGESTVAPTPTRGRYDVSSDLNMAGTWRLDVTWNGPLGQGKASMRATAS